MTEVLYKQIHADLSRPHAFALERVGFIACRHNAGQGAMQFLAEQYLPVDDADYIQSNKAAAMMGATAIRKALQHAYNNPVSVFHIHRHEHHGKPKFSPIDLHESRQFVPNFWNVRPTLAHGVIVLSHDSATGLVWNPADRDIYPMQDIQIIGRPSRRFWE
jgi:hypothetical protein